MLFTHSKIFPLYVLFPLFTVVTLALRLVPSSEPNLSAAPVAEIAKPTTVHTLTLDRIESEWAVLYSASGQTVHLPAAELPSLAAEGDILRVQMSEESAVVEAQIDWEATRLARNRSRTLLQEVLAGSVSVPTND